MSAEEEPAEKCCSSCGKAEIDEIKLKDCDGGCDLARYCGDECQKEHVETHEAICKERAAKLRDEILFKQNESSHCGDCPICCLPLPIDEEKYGMYSCCGKMICKGCDYANKIREAKQRLKQGCPFCRKWMPKTDEEHNRNYEKRAAANDPAALRQMGRKYYKKGEYGIALKYWSRAAELGYVDAHYNLATMYHKGEGVEKDEDMEIYHLEEAAIAGHPKARLHLGLYEGRNERYDRAVKHFIIAANLGHDNSMNQLKECYKLGLVSKDDLAAALRAHHAAVKATKSPEREAAARHYKQNS